MIGRFARFRLLPLSIAAMAMLLVLKSVAIVRAAVPAPTTTGSGPDPIPKPHAPGVPAPQAVPPPRPSAAPAQQAEPPVSAGERALLLDLRARRKELDARDAALALSETVLAATEKRLMARADELIVLQKKLEAMEKARHDHDEANWSELVKVYEGMKPKDAAAIFNDLDLAVALPVFDRMKAAKMAIVLAAMQPERARLVTTQLAQMRNKTNAVPGGTATAAKNGS